MHTHLPVETFISTYIRVDGVRWLCVGLLAHEVQIMIKHPVLGQAVSQCSAIIHDVGDDKRK